MNDLPVKIRSIKEQDKALIVDSWANSACYSTPAFFWVPPHICKSIYRQLVKRLLETRPELFRVVVNESDEDQIFGWVCGDARVTHFVFVKQKFRDEGLGSLLINQSNWVFSHWTKDCERMGKIEYKPSLFVEVIRGLDQTVERDISSNDQSVEQISANNTHHRRGYAENPTVRVDP